MSGALEDEKQYESVPHPPKEPKKDFWWYEDNHPWITIAAIIIGILLLVSVFNGDSVAETIEGFNQSIGESYYGD